MRDKREKEMEKKRSMKEKVQMNYQAQHIPAFICCISQHTSLPPTIQRFVGGVFTTPVTMTTEAATESQINNIHSQFCTL